MLEILQLKPSSVQAVPAQRSQRGFLQRGVAAKNTQRPDAEKQEYIVSDVQQCITSPTGRQLTSSTHRCNSKESVVKGHRCANSACLEEPNVAWPYSSQQPNGSIQSDSCPCDPRNHRGIMFLFTSSPS